MSAKARYFRPGEFLFKEGEPAQNLYILKKGVCSIRKRFPGGFIELGKVYSNEVVGELAFFNKSPRSASVVAVSEVEALEVSYSALDQIYKKVPDYFRAMMASVAERLRRADDVIKRLKKEADIAGSGEEVEADSTAGEEEMDATAALATTADIGETTSVPGSVPAEVAIDEDADLEAQMMAEVEAEAKADKK